MRVKLTLDDVYCVTAWGEWPVLVGSNRPQRGMLLEIEKPRGDYRGLVLGEYNEKASVCVREDFAGKDSNAVSVNIQPAASGQPIKAVILFAAAVPEATKRSAFAFSAKCLVRPRGCDNTQELPPTPRDLEKSADQPRLQQVY
jgi:hypothetical protein